jgi:hypothetical protein
MKSIIISAACLLLLAGCGSKAAAKPAAPKTITVNGLIHLHDQYKYGSSDAGSSCQGYGGYADMAPGVSVVIYDSSQKVLVTTGLGQGVVAAIPGNVWGQCDFTFEAKNVPAGVGPYSVEVSHRGKIVFNEVDSHHVELTLGQPSF